MGLTTKNPEKYSLFISVRVFPIHVSPYDIDYFKRPQNVFCTSLYALHQDTAYKSGEKEFGKPVFVLRDILMKVKGWGKGRISFN